MRIARVVTAMAIVVGSGRGAAAAGQFLPSMVEVGMSADGEHVIFAPAFPSAPKVAVMVAVKAVIGVVSASVACAPKATNITAEGFDYTADCNLGIHPDAVWIATVFE